MGVVGGRGFTWPCPAGLRKHDVCFLVSIRAKMGINDTYISEENFATQVRPCLLDHCHEEGGYNIKFLNFI